MPKQTNTSTLHTIFIRQPIGHNLLNDTIKKINDDHIANPQAVEVHIGLDQLEYIKKCIQKATYYDHELDSTTDQWDDNMGESLIGLIDMTIKDPGVYGTLHGWVV
jgi:hypothetical protein